MKHFKDNNLFSKKQYGFITGRSTVLQLLNILDIWTAALEEGGCIDVIYTDFEKAFDKVPRERLLSKLRSYGISEDIIAWIKKFLCCRKQRVKIKGKFSKWFKVLSGIPQGSALPSYCSLFISMIWQKHARDMLVPSYLQTTPRFFSISSR